VRIDVRRAAADIDDAGPEFLLVVGQYRVARGELLEDNIVHFQAAALHALDDVLCRALGACHHVDLGLEPHAGHADGFADAFLAIDQEFLRQDVQYLLVRGYRDRLGRIDDAIHVPGRYFLVADCDDAVRIQAADVAAGNSRVNRMNITPRHQFGFLDRALDRMHRRLDVYDDTLLQATRWM
jgi:hypothetical protein